MSAFLKNIQNTAHRFGLWKRGDRMVVAVSGGPDSTCLLHLLAELAKKYEWKLHIAHVNYRLRGEESDADEALVRKHADSLDIPITVFRLELSDSTSNLEARLRVVRYEFFESLRMRLGFDLLAVAHTEDDQAETVLLRLLRGAGLRGLGAMRPRDGAVVRPLLFTPKSEVLRFLQENDLAFRIDRSNVDPRFTRNRVRHELLPLLETFNPNIRGTLARTALLLANDAEAAEDRFSFPGSEKNDGSSPFFLDADEFSMFSIAQQRFMLRNLFMARNPADLPPSLAVIEEARKFFVSKKNKRAEKSFLGLKFTRRGATVSVLPERK